ncbi:hypothetical protein [Rhodococcus sp. NPDC127528]
MFDVVTALLGLIGTPTLAIGSTAPTPPAVGSSVGLPGIGLGLPGITLGS